MKQSYYEILEVEKTASPEEIKKSFFKKARKLHPDVSDDPQAEEKFKVINEAYEVLSDGEKRAHYDRFGSMDNAGGSGGFQYVDMNDIFGGGIGDIFSAFFGGAASGGFSPIDLAGRDMSVVLTLSLEEVATGTEKEITYDRLAPCESCDGTGVGEGGKASTCSTCNGRGVVQTIQQTMMGAIRSQQVCPDCGGFGMKIDIKCHGCGGEGRNKKTQKTSVKVPAGIKEGQQLRLEDMGEAGRLGYPSGDLLVQIKIAKHDLFERNGDDLHCAIEISMTLATLGGKLEIGGILPDESVLFKVPSGSQHGEVLREKGFGLARFRSTSRGDLFIHLIVKTPTKLTKKQKQLFEQLSKEFGEGKETMTVPKKKIK